MTGQDKSYFERLVPHVHRYVALPEHACDCEPPCIPVCCSDEPEFERRWGQIEALEWVLSLGAVVTHPLRNLLTERIGELKAGK